jgi:hypothetical protein
MGYADKPGKARALAGVQAAAVTTDLAEITAALRNTALTADRPGPTARPWQRGRVVAFLAF